MSDEPEKPTLEAVKAELESTAHNSVAKILKYLAAYYGGYFPDDYALNREFLKVLASLIGEMFAHFPDTMRDEVVDEAYGIISYQQDMTETELATIQSRAADPKEVKEFKKHDLATMKPMGNC